jgi:hypothetical protein
MSQALNLSTERKKFREGLRNENKKQNYLKDQDLIQLNDQDSVILGYPSISKQYRES